jgi:hypothetical protein
MKKLVLLAVLVLCGFAAWKLGYAGKAIGYARTQADPEDKTLAQYFGTRDADLVVAIHAPLLYPETGTKLDAKWRDMRDEVKRVSGVRLELDVDAVVFGHGLVVLRGRFDWGAMAPALAAAGYKITNLEAKPVALKETGEALVIDGPYALVGTLAGVERAIAERKAGNDPRKGAFGVVKEIGWRHLTVGAMLLSKEQAGIAQLLQGSTAPRSASFAIDRAEQATTVTILVDAGSIPTARELEATIKGTRAQMVEELKKKTDDPMSQEAARMLAAMTIVADDRARVQIDVAVPDTIARWAIDEAMKQDAKALSQRVTASTLESLMRGAITR